MASNPMNDLRSDTLLSKVPAVTLYFWIIKVLCTTIGETAADFLNVNLNFGLTGTSIVTGVLVVVALVVQFRGEPGGCGYRGGAGGADPAPRRRLVVPGPHPGHPRPPRPPRPPPPRGPG